MSTVCDFCKEDVDVLLPVRIKVQTQYGEEMILFWVCRDCYDDALEGMAPIGDTEENEEDEEDEEE